jgi:hypothetical protein
VITATALGLSVHSLELSVFPAVSPAPKLDLFAHQMDLSTRELDLSAPDCDLSPRELDSTGNQQVVGRAPYIREQGHDISLLEVTVRR